MGDYRTAHRSAVDARKAAKPLQEVVLAKINFIERGLHVSSSVICSATLDMRRQTVVFVSSLLHVERRRRGTRKGRRAASPRRYSSSGDSWTGPARARTFPGGLLMLTPRPYEHRPPPATTRVEGSAAAAHSGLDGIRIAPNGCHTHGDLSIELVLSGTSTFPTQSPHEGGGAAFNELHYSGCITGELAGQTASLRKRRHRTQTPDGLSIETRAVGSPRSSA